MKNTLIKYLAVAASVVVLFGSCRKDSFQGEQSEGKGTSFVRLYEAPLRNLYFDKFSDIKEVTLFNIRRDAASSADLKKAITVTLKPLALVAVDSAYLDYTFLPTTIASLNNAALSGSIGGDITVNFGAGQDIQKFAVKLDGSKFDLTKKYAIAYEISDASGLTSKVGKDTILVTVGIKNYLEGNYHATGVFTHPTGGPRPIDEAKYLGTNGPNTVSTTVGDLGGYDLELTVDPATNKVTVGGSVSPAQPIEPVPGLTNTYDPATKTFHVNYQYIGGGGYRVVQEDLEFTSR
ncbi:hypothetical protein FFF34_012215 [Inquilinus sp. KBS0705]|nr:hypothetical protein FFF34_012215 [Inquilinus sp. KBS0705]